MDYDMTKTEIRPGSDSNNHNELSVISNFAFHKSAGWMQIFALLVDQIN